MERIRRAYDIAKLVLSMLAGAAVANCLFAPAAYGGSIQQTEAAYKFAVYMTLCGAFAAGLLFLTIRDATKRESI